MGCEFSGLSEEWRQRITSIHDKTSFIILNTIMCNHSYSTTHQLSLENIDCTQIKYLSYKSWFSLGNNRKTASQNDFECLSHLFILQVLQLQSQKEKFYCHSFWCWVKEFQRCRFVRGSHILLILLCGGQTDQELTRDCKF